MNSEQTLPSLSTLKVFKAAAHHLSFTLAAEELHVTQAAVSHQIKSLETFLGLPLFVRGNRSLTLSREGHRYLPYIDQVFRVLIEGTQLIRQSKNHILSISVLPSFASRWLVPRLGRFTREHPQIDLRIAPSQLLTDFERENIDMCIRYGSGNYAGLKSIHLLDENIFPVCAPALLKGKHPLKRPTDLRHHVLLHDDGHAEWSTWLLDVNLGTINAHKGPTYTDSSLTIQAAIAGDGVALARSELAKGELEKGTLVRPFSNIQSSKYAYYIVYPDKMVLSPEFLIFRDWLVAQTK
ncbi:MAG: transcriptional regulator GcvA [Arenicellales bacterium]